METRNPAPLANVIDLLLDAVCVVDVEGRFVFVSAACERIFGYKPEEMIGTLMLDMVFPDDRERTLQAAGEIMGGQPKLHFENRYVRKDGQVVHIMWSARWSESDQLRIAVARDISERKLAEARQAALYSISEAANSAEDLLALFQRIHQIIGDLLPARNFFVALYDQDEDELSFPYFVDEFDGPPPPRKLDSGTLSAEVIRTGRTLLLTPDTPPGDMPGHVRNIEGRDSLYWLGVPLNSPKGIIGAVVVQSYSGDVHYSEKDKELLQFVSTQVAAAIHRKQMHARLQHIALYDPLTQLPNRALLNDRLATALARARRERVQLSLLYLDLDHFKQINDSLGHAAGDVLLQVVAQRLKQCVRKTDTIARIGGDEFVVLLESIRTSEDAWALAEEIRLALMQPFDLLGHETCVASSIGVALYPQHGDVERQLLQRADEAMYLAKQGGGNRLQLARAPNPLTESMADVPSAA
jgi:diguanylate cyclase (GGDEF)-like protein/PAS domain S-box-containing protein